MCRIRDGGAFFFDVYYIFLVTILAQWAVASSVCMQHFVKFIVICPEHPTPPTLREPITTTPSTVTLEVDHRNTCFESCTFQYEVKVHPAGSPMSTSTTNHSTNTFNVSSLSGGTRYRVEIVAVCVEESTIRSNPLIISFTTRMEGDLSVFAVVSLPCMLLNTLPPPCFCILAFFNFQEYLCNF